MAINYSDFPSQCYLTKIESPNGNIEMEFEYIDNASTVIHFEENGYYNEPPTNNISNTANHSYISRTSKILTKIITPFEQLDFLYTNRIDDISTKLETIIIKNKNGQQIQKRKLNYSYFNLFSYNDKYLKLESVDYINANNYVESSYSLEYESGNLPNMTSKSKDRWGYFSGASNSTLTQTHWNSFINRMYYGADREPDLNLAKIGILKK